MNANYKIDKYNSLIFCLIINNQLTMNTFEVILNNTNTSAYNDKLIFSIKDIVFNIYSFIDFDDISILSFMLTNKTINDIFKQNDYILKNKLLEIIGFSEIQEFEAELIKNNDPSHIKNIFLLCKHVSVVKKYFDYDNTLIEIYKKSTINLIKTYTFNFLPKEIKYLTGLRKIKIIDGKIDTIPTTINKLTNLKKLYFSRNNLREIPIEICDLNNLHTLCVNDNKISIIPDKISKLTNLKELDFSSNKLSNIPQEIKHLTKLKRLLLNNNQITDIPLVIDNLFNLYELQLNDNRITKIDRTIFELPNLRYLDMNNNEITKVPETLHKHEFNRIDISLLNNKLSRNSISILDKLSEKKEGVVVVIY